MTWIIIAAVVLANVALIAWAYSLFKRSLDAPMDELTFSAPEPSQPPPLTEDDPNAFDIPLHIKLGVTEVVDLSILSMTIEGDDPLVIRVTCDEPPEGTHPIAVLELHGTATYPLKVFMDNGVHVDARRATILAGLSMFYVEPDGDVTRFAWAHTSPDQPKYGAPKDPGNDPGDLPTA